MPRRAAGTKRQQAAKETAPHSPARSISAASTCSEMTDNLETTLGIRTRAQSRRQPPPAAAPVPKAHTTKKNTRKARRDQGNKNALNNSEYSRSHSAHTSPASSRSPSHGRTANAIVTPPIIKPRLPRGRKPRNRAQPAKPSEPESDAPQETPLAVKSNETGHPNMATIIPDSPIDALTSTAPQLKPHCSVTTASIAVSASGPSVIPSGLNSIQKRLAEFSSQALKNAANKVPIFSWFVETNNDNAVFQKKRLEINDWIKEVSDPTLLLQLLSRLLIRARYCHSLRLRNCRYFVHNSYVIGLCREEIAMPTKTPAKLRQKNLVNIHGDATQPMQLMDVDDSLPVNKKKQSKCDGGGNGSIEAPSVIAAPERRQTRSSTRTKQNESAAASSSGPGGAAAVAVAAAAPPTSQPAKRSREEPTKVRQSNRSTHTELSHPETNSDPSDAEDADTEGQQAPSSIVEKTMILKQPLQPTCGNLPVLPETPAVCAPAASTVEAMQSETEPTEVTPAPPSKPVRKGRGARAGKQTTTKAAPASAKAASQPKTLPTQIAATASASVSGNSTASLTASVSRPNPLQLARLQQSPSTAHNLIQSCQRPGPPKAVAFAPSPASAHQSTKLGNAKRSMSHGDLSRMGKSPGVTQPASARLRAANSNLNLAQTPGNNKSTNAVQKQQQQMETANAPDKSQSENITQPNICVAVTPAAPTAAAAIAAKKQLLKGAETPVANTASPSKNNFSTPAAVRLDA